MFNGDLAGLARLVCLLHQLADRPRINRAANPCIKTAVRTVIAHCGQVVIAEAIFEDPFKRVAGKALEFEIGPGKEPAALRGPSCYREENVEMHGDLDPDLLDFNPGRISAEQVASEKARLFRQIISRKFMIHAATSESALMRGHTDDRASLVVLIQGFDVRERVIEFIDGCAT